MSARVFLPDGPAATPTSWPSRKPFGDGPIQEFLAETARDLGLWIVGGTLPLTVEGSDVPPQARRVSTARWSFRPTGECVARYDKIHLFRFDNGRERYDESRVLQAGALPHRLTCRRATATSGASA